MNPTKPLAKTAFELRREFDAVFGRPEQPGSAGFEDFLAILLGGIRYAVRLTDTSGLFRNKKITAVPGKLPGLLGLAGFRGTVLPVYDLATLMGHPGGAASRWTLLFCGGIAAVEFDDLDGYIRASQEAIFPPHGGKAGPHHIQEGTGVDGTFLPIVNPSAIVESIREQMTSLDSRKE